MIKVLRTCSFIILLLCAIEPIVKIIIKKKPYIIILLDTSKSMNVGERLTYAKKMISQINVKHKIYGFDSTIYQIRDSIIAKGEITNIGKAIKDAPDASAYLLISDGNNTTGEDPIIVAKNKKIPIYTLELPKYELKDIAIKDIYYPKIAYINEKTVIKINIENIGYDKKKIPIILKYKDKILQKKEILLPKDKTQQKITFEITPQSTEECTYQIKLPELENELTYENNKKIFSINVVKSRIKVLWISSSPTWNFKFAKMELEKAQEIDFDWKIQIAKDKKPEISNINDYDVIILENIKYTNIDIDNVEGIITIGDNEISPFILSNKTRELSSPIEVINHSIFETDSLPPLKEIYKTKIIKEGTSILCKYKDLPIIGEINLGKTKIIGIAAKDVWKWNFYHQIEFWRPIIKYIAIKNIPRLYVKTKKIYNIGERIIFNAEVYTKDYKPDPNCEIIIRIGTKILPLYSLGDGRYSGTINFLPKGTYTYKAISSKGDTTKGNFIVISDMETQNLDVNHTLLQQISFASGGKFIKNIEEMKIKPQKIKSPLLLSKFHITLLLLILLLSLEWIILRKT